MKVLFLESVAGIAGDMFAASFVDAGLVSPAELEALPAALGFEGVRIEVSKVLKAKMQATHVDVILPGGVSGGTMVHAHELHHHHHTPYRELDRKLEASKLEASVKRRARQIFSILAQAEAEAHGIDIEEVEFHEVGTVDSTLDVVMAAHCIEKVTGARVFATPVKLGRGLISMEHGTHPVPAPGCARLAIGMAVAEVPTAIRRPNVELSTPTGLSILKALAPTFVDAVPAGSVLHVGMGAGTMDLGEFPNVFRVMLIEHQEAAVKDVAARLPFERDKVVEITCNLDDETAEKTAWIAEQCLARGALDVWLAPITAKKGRAAVMLSVLVEEQGCTELADWILRNSSTFGVRYVVWDRLKLARRFETRKTASGEVRYKIGLTTDGKIVKEKPEYEDIKKLWNTDLKS